MRVTVVRLIPRDPLARPCPDWQTVVDIMWSAAVAEHRLEHLLARGAPDQESAVDLVLFHRPTGLDDRELALDLCRRAITASPLLADWSAVCRSAEAVDIRWARTLGDGRVWPLASGDGDEW